MIGYEGKSGDGRWKMVESGVTVRRDSEREMLQSIQPGDDVGERSTDSVDLQLPQRRLNSSNQLPLSTFQNPLGSLQLQRLQSCESIQRRLR